MDMQSVKSSQVAAIGYDPATKTMAVEFKHGGTYHYKDVPQEVFSGVATAETVGSALHQSIKGRYEFEKQGEEQK